MFKTKEQFMNQNLFWQDKYYSYAVHKTDAGAVYLFQVDGTSLTKKSLQNMSVIRLDGCDLDKLCDNLKKIKEI